MTVSGVLNIDKDAGWTSSQAVQLVKRRTGARRVGHAGTLDPTATGVLIVCLGQAVRVSEYLMALPKVYRARVLLGITTETYDSEGRMVATAEYRDVSRTEVEGVLAGFVGDIQQLPPVYSALKVGGQPAYRLARQGKPVALKPRPARIYRADLLRFDPPLVEIEVECGKGTYIRSLAHDLGQRLGCGAHLSGLIRTKVGPFDIESAVSLAELQEAVDRGAWQDLLLPMDYGLGHLPAITLDIEDERDLRHGQAVSLAASVLTMVGGPQPGLQCRAYAEDGSLIAIVSYDEGADVWRPRKVFGEGS